ncbi:MAG: hypothetical protein RL154_928 [Pseudomonadota bacterium]|jgi:cytochrome c oxidase cbb3-type subunit 4
MLDFLIKAQGYLYFFITIVLTVLLYAYTYYLWTAKKKGHGDYERYSDLVLHDGINDTPVEPEAPEKRVQEKTQL